MRIAAAGFIGLSCFMTGMMMVARMRARLKLIQAWQRAIDEIEVEMCTHMRPVQQALRAYTGVDRCRVWLNTLADARDIGQAWALLERNARTVPLMPEDVDVLSALIPRLGELDMAQLRTAFEAARTGLKRCEAHAREDIERNSRVYTTLGSLGGMLAAILVI